MSKQTYITDKERKACQKVAAAFAGLYDEIDIAVKDAGKYGFVKLYYFEPEYGFRNDHFHQQQRSVRRFVADMVA